MFPLRCTSFIHTFREPTDSRSISISVISLHSPPQYSDQQAALERWSPRRNTKCFF